MLHMQAIETSKRVEQPYFVEPANAGIFAIARSDTGMGPQPKPPSGYYGVGVARTGWFSGVPESEELCPL